jgi:hypothetical protein
LAALFAFGWYVAVAISILLFMRIMVAMERVRQPRAEVQTVVVFNDQDAVGRWIPMRLEIGGCVTIKPSAIGP